MNQENIKKMNKHYMLWYFFIFSIIGIITETIFYYVTTGNIESRKGFFISPICPIYGIGAVAIIYIFQFFKQSIIKILVISAIAGSIIEYTLSFILEAIYGNRFWDYHYLEYNLNGRICLQYSFYWMIAGLVIIKIIKPLIDKLISKIPDNKIFDSAVFSFLLIDALITMWAVNTYTARTVEKYHNTYIETTIQENADIISKFKYDIENKIFSDKVMLRAFPNIRIKGYNGEEIYARDVINYAEEI